MSLEEKIEILTTAIHALTTEIAMSNVGIPNAPQAPTYVPPTPPVQQATPPAALANGMPGGPFSTPAAPAPSFAAPADTGAPFTNIAECTKYAMEVYGLLEAKAPGRGEVVTQLIQHLCGTGSINDLPVAQYPAFYTELEKQKAL